MKKADEHRLHADECRVLARNAQSDEHPEHLIIIADTWDKLAAERERQVAASGPSENN